MIEPQLADSGNAALKDGWPTRKPSGSRRRRRLLVAEGRDTEISHAAAIPAPPVLALEAMSWKT